ncbi:MAG: NYN domain-containing protein [Oscillospiraceae bacterium]|nr:NYN domain-containing protein [Oscillospiraceae bacterium]
MDNSNLRLAVLIDADNVPRGSIKAIMEEVAIYGNPTVKRIYGDWTNPFVSGWKASLLENAIIPIQQYAYTTGKNSTDSAMIIDAMDILYSDNVDGFVLVSSDSDFTRLAIRLREAGMLVIGIGEKKTPGPFIVACNKFIYIEVITAKTSKPIKRPQNVRRRQEPKQDAKPEPEHKPPEQKPEPEPEQKPSNGDAKSDKKSVPPEIVELIAESVGDLAEDDDGVFMGELGTLLLKKQPDFDTRNFGFRTLTAMIKSIDRFEVELRQTSDPHIKHPYVTDKEASE